jgi:hypothetical protein
MRNETFIAVASITIAVLIGFAAIEWGNPVALAVLLLGLGADWLRFTVAEIGRDWPQLYLVTLAAYPLAALIVIAQAF